MSTTVDVHDSSDAHHQAAHEEHSDGMYIKVGLALAGLTAFEVALSYLHWGTAGTILLFVLMGIKFWTVVSFFMHLRFDHKMFGRLFYSGLILAVVVYVAMLSTYQIWSK
jgi:cytochrome c oxidase subunit 4